MPVEWSFTAESYLDQLPHAARAQVLHALEGLPGAWDGLLGGRLAPVKGERAELFQLRVGGDLRVLLRRRGELITVVDVVRRSQIDGLRRAMRASVTPDQASGPCLA